MSAPLTVKRIRSGSNVSWPFRRTRRNRRKIWYLSLRSLERDGDLGVGRAVADEVGSVDLCHPEERHLDGVEEARLSGTHVPRDERRPTREVDLGLLVAADVLDGQAA